MFNGSVREFTEEQLNAGKNTLPLSNEGINKDASQSVKALV
jgi:hypothetical protein